MKIVVTGGGSGGHITPILAVAHELKALQPEAEIIYIGQKGDKLSDIPAQDPNIDAVYTVWAGKLRRYADESTVQRLLDVRTMALNMRDGFRVLYGTWQSWRLLGKLDPDVIFTRGGFVCVPVALAGKLRRVPYITHDSDSVPSLANRLIARWAAVHAVALPPEVYPYPAAKTVMVGVPVNPRYEPVTEALYQRYRDELGIPHDAQVVLITGGGNGSKVLNEACVANARYLLATFPGLIILHSAGRDHEAAINAAYDALDLGAARLRVRVHGFTSDLYRYSGAADIVLGRAGATAIAEFAQQAKACLMVPPKQLAWAIQNSHELSARGAIIELDEDQIGQPERLGRTIGALLEDPNRRQELARQLAEYAHPQAAAELAALIVKTGGKPDVRPS